MAHEFEFTRAGWHVVIQTSKQGYFEKEFVTTYISGILELNGTTVEGYDGVFELPKPVVVGLQAHGFTFAHNVLPEDK